MTEPTHIPRLRTLIEAALTGGREVLAVYATEFHVDTKGDDSPVSEADRRAEAAIEPLLAAAFPDIPVVAEEASSDGRVPATEGAFFLVDPLDGTKEFIKRNGEFTVNIGLIENCVPVAGVVLAPALRRIYVGDGETAWAGTVEADCASVSEWWSIRTRAAGSHPVAVASRSHTTPETEQMLARMEVEGRRSIGSSLKFCLLAAAEADFYPRMGPTMEWDTAAGDAVLRAAGGAVVDLDGKPLSYGKRGVPGMREFENPFFLAVGDRALLSRLDLQEAA